MYSFDYLDQIRDSIENKIYVERLQYVKIYEIIEEYISKTSENKKNAVMIGGTMGVNLLLQKERTYNDFSYELYTENAFVHANNLINKIAESNNDYIVFLKTAIPNMKYQIFVDMRIIATFYKLSEGGYDLILPVSVKTFDQKLEVLVVSPEIQLIDIYRTLYSPNRADDWENNLYDESKLFNHLKQRINDKITSGSEISITLEERKLLELQLLKQFVSNNENVVLIGEHALKIIINTETTIPVVQIISQNDIETDFSEIEKIIKKTFKRNIPVTKFTRDLHIMQDFRIRRTTIKIGDTDNQKDIVYLYNAAQYDLIPYNLVQNGSDKIRLGNPFVLLRFLLIDFWMVRWVKRIGGIDESFAMQRLDSILNKILKLRIQMQSHETTVKNNGKKIEKTININPKSFDSYENSQRAPFRIFQSLSEDYVGFYDDENISQKLMIKDLTKKYHDYYPDEYKKKFGNYRNLVKNEGS